MASIFDLEIEAYFYSCALQLYSLHREVHSENVFYANICTKKVQVHGKYAFKGYDGAYGVWFVCEPFSQQWYIHWYMQTSLVMVFVLLVPYQGT